MSESEAGRDYVRTVACGWCGRHDVSPTTMGGNNAAGIHVRYRCADCERVTVLRVRHGEGNRVHVVRGETVRTSGR